MVSFPLFEHFEALPDPRKDHTRRHKLLDIVTIAVCATVAGCDHWTHVEAYGKAHYAGFKTFLELPNGIPSHDTFGRFFAALDPAAFQAVFGQWVQTVCQTVQGVVALDGKTARHSFDTDQKALHVVSAWAAENRLVLGQVKTEDRSNEITAIPVLLKLLDVKGCLITIDAMGCQTDIAEAIVEGEADYLLAVKDNQETLAHDLREEFQAAQQDGFRHMTYTYHKTIEKDHGRIEVRECWFTPDVEGIDPRGRWPRLAGMALCRHTRTVKGETSVETRYYITSRKKATARTVLEAVRSHWGIENRVHWVLDMAFGEDASRVRKGHGAENFATLRKWALNLLRGDTQTRLGVKGKRLKAGWDRDYLTSLLTRSHY